MRDLETVVDAAGLNRFALLGISQGCAVSIAYAVRHPERVSHLVLLWRICSRPGQAQSQKTSRPCSCHSIRQGWGQRKSGVQPVLHFDCSSRTATPSRCNGSTTCNASRPRPRTPSASCRRPGQVDISDLLPRVTVPTLVLHAVTMRRYRSTKAARLQPAFRAPGLSRSKAAIMRFWKVNQPGRNFSTRRKLFSRRNISPGREWWNVRFGSLAACPERCLLCPRKRTFAAQLGMSALCQKRTSGDCRRRLP